MQGQSALDSGTFLTGCVSHRAVKRFVRNILCRTSVRWQILRKLCVIRKGGIESFVQMPYVIVF